MSTPKDFNTTNKQTWCPGCGNFGTEVALKGALAELGLSPEKVVLVFDIGCSGNANNWYRAYTFHSLHGRSIPLAEGIKLANHEETVIVFGGDGGIYAEGGNHLIHAARRNIDITCIVANNQIYGLTTGQASPTSNLGFKTKTTPEGVVEAPLQPLALTLAISQETSFVARGFAGDISHLQKIIVEAIKHKGFSLVDVLQPCVTFNNLNTFDWFRKRIYKLDGDKSYNQENKMQALEKSMEWPSRQSPNKDSDEKIPIGIFYKKDRPVFEDHFPQIKDKPLYKQDLKVKSLEASFKEFY